MKPTKLEVPENCNYEEDRKEMCIEMIGKMFWIDPEGKVYKYKGHWDFAELSFSLHYLIAADLYPDVNDPEDYLHELNWMAVGSEVYGNRIDREPSQAQINKMELLGIDFVTLSSGEKLEFNFNKTE